MIHSFVGALEVPDHWSTDKTREMIIKGMVLMPEADECMIVAFDVEVDEDD